MRREDFLSQFWTPYPAAPSGCVSLSRASLGPASSGWIGGILSWNSVAEAEGGKLQLISAAQALSLQWDLPYLFVKSEDDEGQPLAQLSVSHILQPGDQVAALVQEGRISKLMLLAPALRERPLVRNSNWLQKWPKFLADVRNYFSGRGYLELSTPSLVTCPGLEPTLEPFSVGSQFLPTSPEIQLKKALALGFSDIFEIKLCYRKGEDSEHHSSEFHMLEWYRSYANLSAIQDDLHGLIRFLSKSSPFTANLKSVTFSELFQTHLGFRLTPQTGRADLCALAGDLKIPVSETDSWNDVFHRIFVERIEPHFKDCLPTIVRGFPPSMAALARLTQDGWADRMEFYWAGLEIANGFHEVNDPVEQEKRWQLELEERKHLGTSVVPADPDLIEHMKMAMPPAGGIALGLERLFMALYGVENIRSTRLFGSRS